MAIKRLEQTNLNHVEVISENDDALDLENSDFEKYRETANVNHLKFLPDLQPTTFVCNFNLKGRDLAGVQNAIIDGTDDDGKPKVALGSWSYKVAKVTLKDIKNPDYLKPEERIEFKKDHKGLIHDDILTMLHRAGVVNEILGMYTSLTQTPQRRETKN